MVLEFGLINNGLFPNSDSLGIGIGTNVAQAEVSEAYNGQLIVVEGTSDITLSDTAFTDIDDMTYTVKLDGLYLVMLSMAASSKNTVTSTTETHFKLLQNSTTIGAGLMGSSSGAVPNEIMQTVNITALVNLVTGDVVKAQWNTSHDTNDTAACKPTTQGDRYHRKLILTRLWSA